MKNKLLTTLISMTLSMLTPELLKQFADMFLDFIEDYVLGTKSKVDDAVILPMIGMIRQTYDIPDDQEQAVAEADNIPPPADG